MNLKSFKHLIDISSSLSIRSCLNEVLMSTDFCLKFRVNITFIPNHCNVLEIMTVPSELLNWTFFFRMEWLIYWNLLTSKLRCYLFCTRHKRFVAEMKLQTCRAQKSELCFGLWQNILNNNFFLLFYVVLTIIVSCNLSRNNNAIIKGIKKYHDRM